MLRFDLWVCKCKLSSTLEMDELALRALIQNLRTLRLQSNMATKKPEKQRWRQNCRIDLFAAKEERHFGDEGRLLLLTDALLPG